MKRFSGIILALFFLTYTHSFAQIEKIGSKNVEITLPQKYDAEKPLVLPLLFVNTSTNPGAAFFEISSFVSGKQQAATVEFYASGSEMPLFVYDGATVVSDSSIAFSAGEIREFRLSILLPEVSAEYNGVLSVHSLISEQQNVNVETESINISLRRYSPEQKLFADSTLRIHNGSDKPMHIKRFLWGLHPDLSDFAINIANTSKTDTVRNLVVKPISVLKTENDIIINQQFEPDSFRSTVRRLPTLSSQNVALPFPPMDVAGTYDATFSIEADNIKPQRFSVHLHLKRPALYAALIILIGSLISYTVTRGFVNLKKRGDRDVKIRKIRRESEDLTGINRIVRERIRALASVAKDLNQKFFFNNNDKTLSFLKIAEFLVTVSHRKEAIWKTISAKEAPPGLIEEVKDYFKEIDRLVMKYDIEPYKNEITANLNDAEKCTTDEKAAAYALKLQDQLSKLLAKYQQPVHSKKSEIGKFEDSLREQLTIFLQKENPAYGELKPAEIALRMYNLIIEYKDEKQLLQDAIKAYLNADDTGSRLYEAMKVAKWDKENEEIWRKIANNAKDISIKAPSKPTANEVGIYSIDFGSEEVNNSYLVRKILNYHWTFNPAHQYKLTTPVLKMIPETGPVRFRYMTLVNREFKSQERFINQIRQIGKIEDEQNIRQILEKAQTPPDNKVPVPPSNDMKSNSVPKYFPESGSYNISVTIDFPEDFFADSNKKNELKINQRTIEVRENEDIKWYRQWNKYEMGLSGIAFLFAVFSGLQSEYFRKPDFGSWDDFLTLFIWAVGFDQGKNFLTLVKDMRDKQKDEV